MVVYRPPIKGISVSDSYKYVLPAMVTATVVTPVCGTCRPLKLRA